MTTTTDPHHPDLTRGGNDKPTPQSKVYLVLSEEERRKGFVRPVRLKYQHVGMRPRYPLRDLTEAEFALYGDSNYVKYEEYPYEANLRSGLQSTAVGRFWTQKELDTKGCGAVTSMHRDIAETYAREPGFYGYTYCIACQRHLPVKEFVWDGTDERVGS